MQKVQSQLTNVPSSFVHLELTVHHWPLVWHVTSFPRACEVGAILLRALSTGSGDCSYEIIRIQHVNLYLKLSFSFCGVCGSLQTQQTPKPVAQAPEGVPPRSLHSLDV